MNFEKNMQTHEQTSRKKYTPEEILKIISKTESESVILKAEIELKNELAKIREKLKKIGAAEYLLKQMDIVLRGLDKVGERKYELSKEKKPTAKIIRPGEILSDEELKKMLEENDPKYEA